MSYGPLNLAVKASGVSSRYARIRLESNLTSSLRAHSATALGSDAGTCMFITCWQHLRCTLAAAWSLEVLREVCVPSRAKAAILVLARKKEEVHGQEGRCDPLSTHLHERCHL
jgi:hypothetical protein